jgi:hypothetical protein
MTTELRQHRRKAINQAMVYTTLDSEGNILARGIGRALDISPNGIMMETKEPVSEKQLRVRISLPNGESISIEGELIYSLPFRPETYRTGVKFADLEKAAAEAISGLEDLEV